jgi:predicted DNA-binding antitoxin AbrB/MazE fold protein
MKEEIQAVFENGMFRPLRPPCVREGEAVTLVVRSIDDAEPDSLLATARAVYEGLSEQEVTEVETLALERKTFFGEQP